MPRTSYALKAAGLSIAVMLVAAFPATAPALQGGGRASGGALFALEYRFEPRLGTSQSILRLLDTNLRPMRSTTLPDYPYDLQLARSPDGTRLALATGGRLRVLRWRDFRIIREASFPASFSRLVWPRTGTLFAVEEVGPSLRLVDLDSAVLRVRSRWLVPGSVTSLGAIGGHLYAVTDNLAAGVRVMWETRFGVMRTRRLPLARVFESWHVRTGARLPPHAREAVARTRSAAAAAAGVPAEAVHVRGVQISGHNFCEGTIDPFADGLSGYRVHIDVGASHLAYAYGLNPFHRPGELVRCWNGEPRRYATSYIREPARDLLAVPTGTWEVPALSTAADPARHRLLVAAGGAPTSEMSLPNLHLRRGARAAPARLWDRHGVSFGAVNLRGGASVFETGSHVVVLSRGLRSSHVLARGTIVGAAPDRVVVETPSATYVGFDALGRRRYGVHLPGRVGPAVQCENRVYIRRQSPRVDGWVVTALDVRRGRRILDRTFPRSTEILGGPSRSC